MIDFTVNLRGHYTLNEPAASQAIDIHAGRHLADHSGVGSAPGILAGCRTPDGTKWLSGVDAGFDLLGTQDFLLSMWLQAPFNYDVTFASILAGVNASLGDGMPKLSMNLSYFTGSNVIALELDDENFSVPIGHPAPNTWFHILAWRSLTLNQIGVRINDSIEATAPMNATEIVPVHSPTRFSLSYADFWLNSSTYKVDTASLWIGQTKTVIAATNLFNGGTPLPYSSYGCKGFDF